MLPALGLIETKGLVGAIEAADAMCKAANVKLISKEKVTGALMVVKVEGEVAAVKSAVDAGAAAAQRVGELVSAHVIPRPDDQIESIMYETDAEDGSSKKSSQQKSSGENPKNNSAPAEEKVEEEQIEAELPEDEIEAEDVTADEEIEPESDEPESTDSEEIPPIWALQKLNVHELRKLARSVEHYPIKGRDISKANRSELIEYFKSIR